MEKFQVEIYIPRFSLQTHAAGSLRAQQQTVASTGPGWTAPAPARWAAPGPLLAPQGLECVTSEQPGFAVTIAVYLTSE